MSEDSQVEERRQLLRSELDRLLDWLVREYGAEKVIVFGSAANDRIHAWSDLDLVVIKRTPSRFLERMAEVLDQVKPRVGLDVLVYTPEEWVEQQKRPFVRREIMERGRVLYAA
jgi:uncharacterized protein